MDYLIITEDHNGVNHLNPEIFFVGMVFGAAGPDRTASAVEIPLEHGQKMMIHQRKDQGSTTGWLVWPVSAHLCEYILMHPDAFAEKRVLELGSGTGLVGICCNKIGASVVVMTDLLDCIPICKANLYSNTDVMNNDLVVRSEELRWGDIERCRVLIDSYGDFDIIIGSDIVYHQDPEVLRALVATVVELSSPNTVFMLAYEYRECMIEDEVDFFAPLRDFFASVNQVDLGGDRWLYKFSEFTNK